MSNKLKQKGFSLTEVLLAVGTLAVGMVFIGATFLVGMYLTTKATEETIAAVVADEAFAKIKLYRVDFDPILWPGNPLLPVDLNRTLACVDFNDVSGIQLINPDEFAYPSAVEPNAPLKQYYWSALCRRVHPHRDSRSVQVTVFVSRKAGAGKRYRNPADPFDPAIAVDRPLPVQVVVSKSGGNVLAIQAGWETLINGGYTIVENTTGAIYRVVKRDADQPDRVILDRDWDPNGTYPDPDIVWVIPPPVGGGRYPCIAVYQTEIRF